MRSAESSIENKALQAMHTLQRAMKGEAERTGLLTEENVIEFVKQIRKEGTTEE